MGAVLNGMVLSKYLIPYGATFLIFSDYMRPPLRLAAIMKIRPIMVYTHDSIAPVSYTHLYVDKRQD